jgi:hypothetical protein
MRTLTDCLALFSLADGFTLMVIFFLVHVKNPPVLPNLQRIAPLRPMSKVRIRFGSVLNLLAQATVLTFLSALLIVYLGRNDDRWS